MKNTFKGKGREELTKSLKEHRKELRSLDLSTTTSSAAKKRQLRKDIARILTEINTQKQ